MLTLTQELQFTDSAPPDRYRIRETGISKPTQIQQLDRFLQYIVVPILGIFIPNAMQLINNTLYSPLMLAGHYCYFIFVSFLVWKGNVFCLNKFRGKFISSQWNYSTTVVSYFLINVIYSGLISFSMLYGWARFSTEAAVQLHSIFVSSLIVVICVVFINNVYELFYLHAERTDSEHKATASYKARIRAELQVLKGQFDPHFLYNSLNVLSYLIIQSPPEAEAFNVKLGMLMQYPIKQKCNDWVLLNEELEFTKRYFELQQLRYGHCIHLHIRYAGSDLEYTHMVPPMALQLLIENAIKHNCFTDKDPLHIYITADEKFVKVRNKKCLKPSGSVPCSGTGLIGLKRRMRLLCNKTIEIKDSGKQFSVTLPMIPVA